MMKCCGPWKLLKSRDGWAVNTYQMTPKNVIFDSCEQLTFQAASKSIWTWFKTGLPRWEGTPTSLADPGRCGCPQRGGFEWWGGSLVSGLPWAAAPWTSGCHFCGENVLNFFVKLPCHGKKRHR